jgi:hypothetical protein
LPEPPAWEGVIRVDYAARGAISVGRAYEFKADRDTHRLSLGRARKVRGLRVGGFQCGADKSATYAWARFNGNYVLRLEAVQEPCAARRAILEGDWQFLD